MYNYGEILILDSHLAPVLMDLEEMAVNIINLNYWNIFMSQENKFYFWACYDRPFDDIIVLFVLATKFVVQGQNWLQKGQNYYSYHNVNIMLFENHTGY